MTSKLLKFGLPLAALLAIAGCGGGGGGGGFVPVTGTGTTTTGSTLPPDQTGAFMSFVKSLVATQPEAAAQVSVTQFDPPPTTETAVALTTP